MNVIDPKTGRERRVTDPKEQRRVIAEARKRCEARVHACACTPYVHMDEGMVTQVECRLCGRAVSSLQEVGPGRTTRLGDGTKQVTRHVALRRLPHRRGIRILFDDGSAHETEVCADCAGKLTHDQLEAIYCRDLCQFAADEDVDGVQPPWHVMADRKPVGFEKMND